MGQRQRCERDDGERKGDRSLFCFSVHEWYQGPREVAGWGERPRANPVANLFRPTSGVQTAIHGCISWNGIYRANQVLDRLTRYRVVVVLTSFQFDDHTSAFFRHKLPLVVFLL